MMKIIGIVLGGMLLAAVMAQLVGFGVFYTVDQTEYVVITQFGEVQRSVMTPGLKFKSPIESVVHFDRRLLRIDVPVASMPDKESQFLEIDAYVRYRISDPRAFLESLRDESTAGLRIGNLAISAIRDEVGLRDRKDIIGGGDPVTLEDGTIVVKPRVTESGQPSREAMMETVIQDIKARAELDFGIEILDVRIKRADFPTAVENSVFQRMRTERDVQAQRLRAEGEEAYLTITAEVSRNVRVIAANAERNANVLRGEGEAQGVQIFARVLSNEALKSEALDALEALEALDSESVVALRALGVFSAKTLDAVGAGDVLDLGSLLEALDGLQSLNPEALQEALGPEAFDAVTILGALGPGALEPIDSDALAEALEFFTFRRSLEAYTNSLIEGTTLVLSADSDLFQYLESSSVR
jgi:membrane protease subunit HflC